LFDRAGAARHPAGRVSDPSPADDALLAAWLAGDRKAGFELFERHYDAVARFFQSKVGEHSGDLVQRTFLACVESLPSFRGRASFRSWLFAIAYRQLCRHFRDRAREQQRLDFTSISAEDLQPSAGAALGQREEVRLLLAALRRIPVELQVLVELHYWEGLTTGEIAEVLEIPPGTVRTRLMRAREQLDAVMQRIAESPSLAHSTQSGFERWAAELRAPLRARREPERR
jgi:RNA polymerase sigma-70 factor (ECF subfamily)